MTDPSKLLSLLYNFLMRKNPSLVQNLIACNLQMVSYSVDPQYIGTTVEIDLSDTEDNIHIYYNGETVRSHPLTTQRFNYNQADMFNILKSDLLAGRPDDDIHEYIHESLQLYDAVGDDVHE